MAHDRGGLVVGQLQLIEQTGVDNDLAAGTTVGVEFVALDQIDFPLPLRGIRPERRRLGNQPVSDGLNTLGIGTRLVEHILAARIAHGLLIILSVSLIDLFARYQAEHPLLANHAHLTGAGGVHGLAAIEQQR